MPGFFLYFGEKSLKKDVKLPRIKWEDMQTFSQEIQCKERFEASVKIKNDKKDDISICLWSNVGYIFTSEIGTTGASFTEFCKKDRLMAVVYIVWFDLFIIDTLIHW